MQTWLVPSLDASLQAHNLFSLELKLCPNQGPNQPDLRNRRRRAFIWMRGQTAPPRSSSSCMSAWLDVLPCLQDGISLAQPFHRNWSEKRDEVGILETFICYWWWKQLATTSGLLVPQINFEVLGRGFFRTWVDPSLHTLYLAQCHQRIGLQFCHCIFS